LKQKSKKLDSAEKSLESAHNTFIMTTVISVAVTIACIAIAILLPALSVALSWVIGLGGVGLSMVAITLAAKRITNAEISRDEAAHRRSY
jgi:hypothetical protein